MSLVTLRRELHALGNAQKAAFAQHFFKTGEGQYAAGDKFLGVTVPEQRKLVRKYRDLAEPDVLDLLHNPWHEERLVALLIFVGQFTRGDEKQRKHIFDLYLRSTVFINNWDLVDASARKIVGVYLRDKSRERLYHLAQSTLLWERRIAIIATHEFISHKEFQDTFALCEILLNDMHDLMHKACGWMLREVGKRDRESLVNFLHKYYQVMPRTMLRYAIEHFPPDERKKYLLGLI